LANEMMLPDLSKETAISIDLETYDPDLKKLGPGPRRDGRILGIAIATTSGIKQYISFGHPEGNSHDEKQVKEWAKKELCREGQHKIGANILYDLDFLNEWGVKVQGPFRDVQVAEPLIDETRLSFSLDSLATTYLDETKETDYLQEYCDKQGWKGKVQSHLWKMPGHVVAPYAETDADLPIRILREQGLILRDRGLMDVFNMESELIPMLLAMRTRGVRVDTDLLATSRKDLEARLGIILDKASRVSGKEMSIWSNNSIGASLDILGVDYKLTPTGLPSITKEFLESSEHEFLKMILEARKVDKIIRTFIDGLISSHLIQGRVHPCFNQLRSDDTGTVSGRFSCTDPNLQQIPARDPELGPLCRSFFVPEPGEQWVKLDYSQIELRILAHYARGNGAQKMRDAYQEDARTDFHQKCADMANIDRRKAKDINFGVVYGMGIKKTASQLGLSYDEAKEFLKNYHRKMPFLKGTANDAMAAANRGYVKTIMGRRRHFPWWQPRDFDLSQKIPHDKDKGKMEFEIIKARAAAHCDKTKMPSPGVERSMRYKALNAVVQGSAADLMKLAMVNIWKSGVCDVLGAPLVTVHDELDWSMPNTKEGKEAMVEVKRLMEKAIEMTVPIIVDQSDGSSWGKVK